MIVAVKQKYWLDNFYIVELILYSIVDVSGGGDIVIMYVNGIFLKIQHSQTFQ